MSKVRRVFERLLGILFEGAAMRMKFDTDQVTDKAKDLYRASRKIARRGTSEANSFIHAKPVLSAVLGVGLGYLLSSLFRSRD